MRYAALRLRVRVRETPFAIWLCRRGVELKAQHARSLNANALKRDQPHGLHFQLTAITPAPGLPHFRISPGGVVQTQQPELVRTIWTPERAATFATWFADSELHAVDTSLTMLRPAGYGMPTVPDEALDAAISFLFDLGEADAFGRTAIASLPGATYHPHYALPYVTVPAPALLRVGFARVGDDAQHLVTEARVAITDVADISPATQGRAAALGAVATIESEQVVLTWPTTISDVKVLRAAIELLRALITGPHEGVFR